MGSEDTMSCLGIDSMDLYSKVKLRGLNGKVHGGRHGNLGLYNVKSMGAGSEKARVSVGIKSRRIDKSEGKITVINSGELATNQGGSRGLKRTCLMAVTTREIDIPYSAREGDRRGVIFYTGCSSDEETAIEVLGALKESRSETMATGFKVGDLVWGNVDTHPWWPGQIFDETRASSLVKQTKIKGCLLVAFFGDNTYGWLKSKDLLPFEPNYGEKLNDSKGQSKAFLTAVQEAVDEVNRRAALAFSCRCRNPSDGYEEGAIYPVDQIKRSREEFKPAEMISFLQELALGPMNMPRDGSLVSNGAKTLAYRKAVFVEKDPTYAEAFGVLARSHGDSSVASNYRRKAVAEGAAKQEFHFPKSQQKGSDTDPTPMSTQIMSDTATASEMKSPCYKGLLSGHSRTNEARGESKVLGKRAKVEKHVDRQKLTRIDCVSKASGDHVSKTRSKSPRRNEKEAIIVGKEPLVSKPSKALPSIVPLEKAPGKSSWEPPLKNRDKTKALASLKGVEKDLVEPGATLLIKFPTEGNFPSTNELKAKFARFGLLDVSATYASSKLLRCQVGFQKMSDAEAARDHFRRNGNMFGNAKVSCYLQSLEVASSPKLPKSPKLPRKASNDVPQLRSSSSGEGASGSEVGGITLHSTEVKCQVDSTMKSQQTISPSASLPPVPALSQLSDAMNKKHLQSSTTTTTNTVDIARPMLKLLNEIDQCIEDLKRKQKHWLYSGHSKA